MSVIPGEGLCRRAPPAQPDATVSKESDFSHRVGQGKPGALLRRATPERGVKSLRAILDADACSLDPTRFVPPPVWAKTRTWQSADTGRSRPSPAWNSNENLRGGDRRMCSTSLCGEGLPRVAKLGYFSYNFRTCPYIIQRPSIIAKTSLARGATLITFQGINCPKPF